MSVINENEFYDICPVLQGGAGDINKQYKFRKKILHPHL